MASTEVGFNDEKFETLSTEENQSLLPTLGGDYLRRQQQSRGHIAILYFTNAITLVIVFGLLASLSIKSGDPSLHGVYFPAKSAVEYVVHRFESAFYNTTAYMGYPTPEIDAQWANLTTYGLSKISDSEAAQLFEPTMSNLDNKSEHLITLDVFHQLHCLHSIRMYFYQDYYPIESKYYSNGTENKAMTRKYKHWDHCIDSIRQSLMCSADITPVVFHIDERGSGIFPKLQGTHVCRNWDKVTDWAREHSAGDNIRFLFKEGDELLDYYRSDPEGFVRKGGSE